MNKQATPQGKPNSNQDSVGEVYAADAAIRMDLYAQSLNVVCTSAVVLASFLGIYATDVPRRKVPLAVLNE